MDFTLSEEQTMIAEAFRGQLTRDVTLDVIRTQAALGQAGKSPTDQGLWQQLTEMGLPGLLIDDTYGGAGLGMLEAVVVGQELGRAAAPVPFAATCVMAPLAITASAEVEQHKTWLTQIAAGEMRVGVALGADMLQVDSGRISGHARFVFDAGGATHFLLETGGVFYLVEAHASGVYLTLERPFDPLQSLGHLALDTVPATPLSGVSVDRVTEAGRIALAAQTIGACEFLLDASVEYAADRVQFGRPIGSFQAIKHMCAEMAAQLYPAISLVWYAGYVFDKDAARSPLNSLLAKALADEAGRFISRTAIEVHGGMGYTDLQGLHYWYKRAAFNRNLLGNPEELRQDIAAMQGI
ncbi:acyl-CoA dehydrogenase family protein [uncultured Sulfitobacter sp.]|uniref:acyl-CoA dehydrogenase family protein n=1 Tax=uncultured Sulfitobacter sp. TaxID=191468 RepID=UPI00261A96B5|nr:acyl-CoA dehydrogenase family protein [uncultured Sulfitobacter sp.]